MQKESITQAELKKLLDYDPETGVLVWIKARKRGGKDGDRAGYVHHRGYRYLEVNGKHWSEHRLIWLWVYGEVPNCSIDHINGKFDDNRLCNLRLAENNGFDQLQNRALNRNSTTGHIGVTFNKKSQKYMARIQAKGKSAFLGLFATVEEAAKAYKEAKKVLHPFNPIIRD